MSLQQPSKRPAGRIPYYGTDNRLQDWITPERAIKMQRTGMVRAIRTGKGEIVRCIRLRHKEEAKQPTVTSYRGQKYSFREPLANIPAGVWRFKKLGRGSELRPVFVKVLTDCLVQEGARA